MSDLEGIAKLKLKILDSEDPERTKVLTQKLEKLKEWEHPRVTQKMDELRRRGLIA